MIEVRSASPISLNAASRGRIFPFTSRAHAIVVTVIVVFDSLMSSRPSASTRNNLPGVRNTASPPCAESAAANSARPLPRAVNCAATCS